MDTTHTISINSKEINAAEGLLGLSHQNSSQTSLNKQHQATARLNPISPSEASERLPSLSQALAIYPNSVYSSSSSSSACSLNFILSTPICPSMSSSSLDSTVSASFYTSSVASSSCSSLSPIQDYPIAPQKATRNTSRRAVARILNNRRGRPKKAKKNNEIKSIKFESDITTTAAMTATVDINSKPRWQDSERQSLIEVIVQEKKLDDMSTIQWDKVSSVVGRAKKACKDQWRREILPQILKGFIYQRDPLCRCNSNNGISNK